MGSPIAKIGRVTTQSVQKYTRRGWHEWITLLDKNGARSLKYQDITKLLRTRYKLSLWWQNEVALGYEIHIGRRLPGQNQKGQYSTTATKSFALNKKAVWKLVTSPEGLAMWLESVTPFTLKPGKIFERADGIYGQVRTLKPGTRARLSWQRAEWAKPLLVQITVYAKPQQKSLLVIQHENIPTAQLKAEWSAHWKAVLTRLKETFPNGAV